MLQQAALPQSTQGMQVSFAPPPQATLPQSQRVRPSPPNQGQHGYMPRQRPSQPPRQFTQLNQPMNSCNWTVFMSNSRKGMKELDRTIGRGMADIYIGSTAWLSLLWSIVSMGTSMA
ncbi:hypothetical protein L1987_88488 [Smallanthus sonchifolius]|nr:hypothetical protein L1987_88488 [Smallanthus sonchifolius]